MNGDATPTGSCILAQGEERSDVTLGTEDPTNYHPTGVVQHVIGELAATFLRHPFRVEVRGGVQPRVTSSLRSSSPWANMRHPFRVGLAPFCLRQKAPQGLTFSNS